VKTMSCDLGVFLLGCSEDLVDALDKLHSGECHQVVLHIMVSGSWVVNLKSVFDKVFVDCMDRIQRGLLARNPDIVTMGFLGFQPW
jgi:hypothetical protein